MKTLSALIVGCGKIAGGYNASPDDAMVLTHALAYRRHGGYRLAACVEPDGDVRRAFMEKWDIPAGFETVDQALSAADYDVVSVCSPTATHLDVLDTLAQSSVRGVFCEKPVGGEVSRARRVLERFDQCGKPVAVNFTMRWDPALAELAQQISNGEWGDVRAVVGHYVRGLVNNGSHLIDLIHFLFGRSLTALMVLRGHHDVAEDPSVHAVLRLQGDVPVCLIGADGRDYALFELKMVFERGIVALEECGFVIRYRKAGNDARMGDGRAVSRGDWIETRYGEALLLALENLRQALLTGAPLLSSGKTALEAIAVCEELRRRTPELRC